MELAKKIQTVLIPENPSVKGYDVAAFMEPADEVGGDYYDILHFDDKDWIVIGDVSGHGVPAGLVMMMVQTSIHSVLSTNPLMDPSELLTLVNKTIAQNIKRLGESKYMTITVLLLSGDTFYFSGLHQDIIILRRETNKIEEVETRGMWLGVMDDLEGTLENDSLKLKQDDVMVLYTDGITEATLNGVMFGEDRLRKLIKKNGKKSPEELKKRILEELKDYKRDDDITAVILKKI
jgi:histidine kinase